MSFSIGQRWLSHADSELGLGVVMEVAGRRVTLHFPAVEEDRTYAADTAPLTRLRLREGDTLRTRDGREGTITSVAETEDLLVYGVVLGDAGEVDAVLELDLDDHLDLATPRQRLVAGQFDSHAAFALRLRTCSELDRLEKSGLRGLLGTRTALLPHQLYVAREIGERHAPRVLLADEVGLGKTIEAGMILHRQLLSGDSRRVLIIVPDSLQFQWLVEMRRRFNLAFSIYDGARIEDAQHSNPFEEEQLALCGSSLFNAVRAQELSLACPWDLLIVDEAHRFGETDQASEFLQALSRHVRGMLLLTATPEQVGQKAHFERLALLDPERFQDFESFQQQEQRYRQWSDLVQAIERGEDPQGLPEDVRAIAGAGARVAALIDRYGTGRVLFRSTRAAVGGFPTREFHPHPLPRPDGPAWLDLHPETHMDEERWLQDDPRVGWLVTTLRELRPAKVLVICAHADTALALESYLQLRAGVRSAAFHEELTLVERDRAAAYFAPQEQGAQALICSEIGGEGRNFQFAQHLVLFDLPEHPDQLEQRIGRLDRIGQRDVIHIHAPYLQGSAQETLLRWYDEGMNAFRLSCSAGDMILARFQDALEQHLAAPDDGLGALLEETATFTSQTRDELSAGRDRLLERSSCDREAGSALADAISTLEDPATLGSYLEQLCEVAGVEHEDHSEHAVILRPAEQEALAVFPELPEEGCTVTFSRDRALEREDWIFLAWEHPWLEGAMESVLGSSLGQAAVGTLTLKGVPGGSRLYELVFTLSVQAPRSLGLGRYLSLDPQRLLLDARGRDLSALLTHDRLNERIEKLPRGTALKVVKQLREEIEATVERAETMARKQAEDAVSAARQRYADRLTAEEERLRSLQQRNGAVREDEIHNLQSRRDAGLAALTAAQVTLQGLRLVVTQ